MLRRQKAGDTRYVFYPFPSLNTKVSNVNTHRRIPVTMGKLYHANKINFTNYYLFYIQNQ